MAKRSAIWLLTSALVVVLALSAPSAAAPPHAGSLDKTFGRNGRVVFNLPGERVRPRAFAVDRAGRIVVVGHLTASADQYLGWLYGRALVVRFRRDGALDSSFGEGGVARIELPRPVAIGGLLLQPDGAVLLSGTASGAPWNLGAVARLLPSGAVDRAFGSDGLATVPGEIPAFPPSVTALPHLGVQADGRIVAAGWQRAYDVHSVADPFVVRLMPDGAPDTSFGGDGTTRNGPVHPIAVVRYPDGRMVVAGQDEEYFGGTFFTAFTIDPGSGDYPCCAPIAAVRRYRYNGLTRGIAAQTRADGSLVIAAARYGGMAHPFQLAWIRIDSDGEPLDRGRAPSGQGAQVATFDSRGAILTAGRGHQTAPLTLQRYRGSPPSSSTARSETGAARSL
jgi:uncharacterized delta-60 repeat protein